LDSIEEKPDVAVAGESVLVVGILHRLNGALSLQFSYFDS
jgi:hypothetical protein